MRPCRSMLSVLLVGTLAMGATIVGPPEASAVLLCRKGKKIRLRDQCKKREIFVQDLAAPPPPGPALVIDDESKHVGILSLATFGGLTVVLRQIADDDPFTADPWFAMTVDAHGFARTTEHNLPTKIDEIDLYYDNATCSGTRYFPQGVGSQFAGLTAAPLAYPLFINEDETIGYWSRPEDAVLQTFWQLKNQAGITSQEAQQECRNSFGGVVVGPPVSCQDSSGVCVLCCFNPRLRSAAPARQVDIGVLDLKPPFRLVR